MSIKIDKSSKTLFADAIKNIKSLVKEKKNVTGGKRQLKVRQPRGVVYLGHLPHGFYEDQMKEYFKQFGIVTRTRVMRSKKTGKSKGYGFIEFLHPEVAEIVAKTMNNYLMNKRILKATYIPPNNQKHIYFSGKNWTEKSYPKLDTRKTDKEQKNADWDDAAHKKFVKDQIKKFRKLKEKLKSQNIEYDFEFSDVPEFVSTMKIDQNISLTSNQSYDGPTCIIDESDEEIDFKIPDFVKVRRLKKRDSKPIVAQESPKKKKEKLLQKKQTGGVAKNKGKAKLSANQTDLIKKNATNILKSNEVKVKSLSKKKQKKI